MKKLVVFKTLLFISLTIFSVYSKPKNENKKTIAISLKQLSLVKKDSVKNDILNLFNIENIMGIIKDNADLILIGESSESESEFGLSYDDLTSIANYYRVNDSLLYCEIFPNKAELDNWDDYLDNTNRRDDTPIQKYISEWERGAGASSIIVKGVDENSHTAKIMVDADIFLKEYAYDEKRIKVKGLKDYLEFLYPRVQNGLERNAYNLGTISCSFWFYPGNAILSKSENGITINSNVIRLYTGGTTKNFKGMVSLDTNSAANKFVNQFNLNINKVIEKVAQFYTLNDLVKLKLLLDQYHEEFSSIWNEKNAIEQFPFNNELKTIRTYNYFESASNITPQGTGMSYYNYMYYCVFGGIDLNWKNIKIQDDNNQSINSLKRAVLKSRPKNKALVWEFTSPSSL